MRALVDTHCHLERYEDPRQVLSSASKAGIDTVAVTELPSHYQRLALRVGRRPGVKVALGIHPLRAGSASGLELSLFARLVHKVEYVGEIGLDRSSKGKPTFARQVKVFEHLLSQRALRGKILTVHSRGAEKETIERLGEGGFSAILHWYSGPLGLIDSAISQGLWFSANPAMVQSKRGQRLLATLPGDRLLVETDGPYTTVSGRPAEPKDLHIVVSGLSRLWDKTPEQVRAQIEKNMSALRRSARANAVTD